MLPTLRRLRSAVREDERGAGLVEYVLLMALIVVACLGALTYFGSESDNSVTNSAVCIAAAQNGEPLPATCPGQ